MRPLMDFSKDFAPPHSEMWPDRACRPISLTSGETRIVQSATTRRSVLGAVQRSARIEGQPVSYYQDIVTEYLRADRAMFVNAEYLIQLDQTDVTSKGTTWYCDVVAVSFREKKVYLCEVTYLKDDGCAGEATQSVEHQLVGSLRRSRSRLRGADRLVHSAVGVRARGLRAFAEAEAGIATKRRGWRRPDARPADHGLGVGRALELQMGPDGHGL